jgi:hypothetical protein
VRPDSDHPPNGGNVVPFARPCGSASRGAAQTARAAAAREASRRAAARRREDDIEDSAYDRMGSIVTLVLFVLFSLFNAWLLLAALGVRL